MLARNAARVSTASRTVLLALIGKDLALMDEIHDVIAHGFYDPGPGDRAPSSSCQQAAAPDRHVRATKGAGSDCRRALAPRSSRSSSASSDPTRRDGMRTARSRCSTSPAPSRQTASLSRSASRSLRRSSRRARQHARAQGCWARGFGATSSVPFSPCRERCTPRAITRRGMKGHGRRRQDSQAGRTRRIGQRARGKLRGATSLQNHPPGQGDDPRHRGRHGVVVRAARAAPADRATAHRPAGTARTVRTTSGSPRWFVRRLRRGDPRGRCLLLPRWICTRRLRSGARPPVKPWRADASRRRTHGVTGRRLHVETRITAARIPEATRCAASRTPHRC